MRRAVWAAVWLVTLVVAVRAGVGAGRAQAEQEVRAGLQQLQTHQQATEGQEASDG